MSWINEYLEKVGLGEVVKLAANSPDKKPDDFDMDKAAGDYLNTRIDIFKSSDQFKNIAKEQQIVALKQYKKKLNEEIGLGLSGEEAATLDPEEFNKKLKEKYTADVEAAKNGKTSEWQDKHAATIKELNDFKALHEKTVNEWTSKYTELENRQKVESARLKRDSVFNDVFSKLDFGKDDAHKENSKIVVKTVMSEFGWNFDEEGKLFKGENEVVTTPDGHTIIRTLEDGIKSIATQRKLFPQANTGGGEGGAKPFEKTGNEEADKLIQASQSRLAKLSALNS